MNLKNHFDISRSAAPVADRERENAAFREFDATELYCPGCRRAVPVVKRLLLVLPDGDKYEYVCAYCAASVGTKIDRKSKPVSLIF